MSEQIFIRAEKAVILWDEAHKVEHFIRTADFETQSKSLGFLVPTPTIPKISVANNEVFHRLKKYHDDLRAQIATGGAGAAHGSADVSVTVLGYQRVAGMDAITLEANNANALSDWLKKNGYVSRPAITDWLKQYVDAHWKITAFKFARKIAPKKDLSDPNGAGIKAEAVRLSFKTDRPFYPYREPSDTSSPADRILIVYYLGSHDEPAYLGQGTERPVMLLGRPISDSQIHKILEGVIPANEIPDSLIASEFIDQTQRRADEELYFGEARALAENEIPKSSIYSVIRAGKYLCLNRVVKTKPTASDCSERAAWPWMFDISNRTVLKYSNNNAPALKGALEMAPEYFRLPGVDNVCIGASGRVSMSLCGVQYFRDIDADLAVTRPPNPCPSGNCCSRFEFQQSRSEDRSYWNCSREVATWGARSRFICDAAYNRRYEDCTLKKCSKNQVGACKWMGNNIDDICECRQKN